MKILIVKLSSMGDLMHALPAVHNLKADLNATIDWVVQEEYVDLVRCFTDVNKVIPFPRKHFLKGLRAFRKELRLEAYDLVVDLQGLFKSGLVTSFARGLRKIGPSCHREFSRVFYNEVAGRRNKDRHAVDELLDVVDHLKLKRLEPSFPVRFPEVEVNGKRPRVALLPVSRWPSKNWPAECFIEVGQRLRTGKGASIHVIGASGDSEFCGKIVSAIGEGAVNMAGRLTVPQTGRFLKKMDLLVANDSGPVHLAAAVGTPALVVFGPTDPKRTGPYGAMHRVVKAELPCQPCFSRSCRRRNLPCLRGVTPERVTAAALEMLAASSRR